MQTHITRTRKEQRATKKLLTKLGLNVKLERSKTSTGWLLNVSDMVKRKKRKESLQSVTGRNSIQVVYC